MGGSLTKNAAQTPICRFRCSLLLSLPPLRVGVPNALSEQAVQIGKVWITIDEEI
jgi:hypothetical protein